MVRDFQRVNETAEIRKLLKVLGQDFTLSHNVNSRKGGLIGLAAMAIALGKVTLSTKFKLNSVLCFSFPRTFFFFCTVFPSNLKK